MTESGVELIWNAEQAPTRELIYSKEFKELVQRNKEQVSKVNQTIKKFLSDNNFYTDPNWHRETFKNQEYRTSPRMTSKPKELDVSALEDVDGVELIYQSSFNATFKISIPGEKPFVIKVLADEDRDEIGSPKLVDNDPIEQALSSLVVSEILSESDVRVPTLLAAFKDAKGGFYISEYEKFDNKRFFEDSRTIRIKLLNAFNKVASNSGVSIPSYKEDIDDIAEFDNYVLMTLDSFMPDSTELYQADDESFVWLDFVLKSVQKYLRQPGLSREDVVTEYGL